MGKFEGNVTMRAFTRGFLVAFLILIFAICLTSSVYSQQSSDKARQILEKTIDKYESILKKDGKGLKSVEFTLSIKGGRKIPMGNSGDMPLDLDATIDLYIERPQRFRLDLSGNLGSAQLLIPGGKPLKATVILPLTKQFATITIPESSVKEVEKMQSVEKREDIWKDIILRYDGIRNVKMGKAHKINIKSKKATEQGSVDIYILDGKWDPVRVEIIEPQSSSPEGEGIVIEFTKLEIDKDIPDSKFSADTKGYTEITQQQLATLLMMQIMSATMQNQQMQQQ